jgi:hypothetical protein
VNRTERTLRAALGLPPVREQRPVEEGSRKYRRHKRRAASRPGKQGKGVTLDLRPSSGPGRPVPPSALRACVASVNAPAATAREAVLAALKAGPADLESMVGGLAAGHSRRKLRKAVVALARRAAIVVGRTADRRSVVILKAAG